jgi:hypothetical protein
MLKAAGSGAPRALPALARAFVAVALLSGGPRFVSAALAPDPLGWRLGVAAWSFKNFTFHEAIDRTAALGLRYLEAFEGLRLLGSRLLSLHVKDLNEAAPTGHDVWWGTGKGDIAGVLREVQRLGIRPPALAGRASADEFVVGPVGGQVWVDINVNRVHPLFP